MLVPILLTILWTALSMGLAWPWFWMQFITNKEVEIWLKAIHIIGGLVTIGLCCDTYFGSNIMGFNSVGIIAWLLILQLFYTWSDSLFIKIPNKKRKIITLVVVLIICLGIGVIASRTSKLSDVAGIELNEDTIIEVCKEGSITNMGMSLRFSSPIIESLLEPTEDLTSTYLNRRFIYQNAGEEGSKIIIFDEEATEPVRIIECNYKYEVSGMLRRQYPMARIEKIDVILVDDTPFAKYAILDKPNPFKAPVLQKFVLQNLITGEIACELQPRSET